MTGSNFMLDTGDAKLLIDCGALQREHLCEPENTKPFPYEAQSVAALLVTHAHADHIGRIPKLVHNGFRGPIYSTPATRDLAELMFKDALNVMRSDQERGGCVPLYEKEDAERAIGAWQTHGYHEPFRIKDTLIAFLDAGHILGSAMVQCTRNKRRVLFTGDLGNSPEPLLHDTESAAGADYLVMESVYGDRTHERRAERADMLRATVEETKDRKGVLLIPSFSIERTQILLFELDTMMEAGKLEPIDVYLDAPLAIRVTEVYRKYVNQLNEDVQEHFTHDDPFAFKSLHVIRSVDESRDIHEAPSPKVIIAGAGMSSGGRIRSHEKRYLNDPDATVLFVGYQAPGSLGRRIAEGQKEVEIDGERVTVRAQIKSLTGYSGHKDRDGLLQFAKDAGSSLGKVFVVMGEPQSEATLAEHIHAALGVEAIVPHAGERIEIDW